MRLNIKARFVIAFCMVVSVSAVSQAQSGRLRGSFSPASDDEKTALKLRAEEVLLPVSVRGDNGKMPSSLERSDFIVSEDGKRQHITSVHQTPANILFILDASGDVTPLKNINVNRDLALKMIASLGEKDRAAIIAYSDKVNLLASWTGDKEQLRQALLMKFKPGLKSSFYDALVYAAAEVLPKAEGRRSVVLLTDGVDSLITGWLAEALKEIHKIRATVYIASHTAMIARRLKPRVFHPLAWFEMRDPRVRERYEEQRRYVRQLEAAETNLKGLAEETGGAMWNPETRDDFESLAARIIEEIGSEYVIAYSSERRPDDTSFHTIKVYVTRSEIKVRTRRGIYSSLPVESEGQKAKSRRQ
ncbi:MAG: VWA domain-containing protein [Blastocatellia bacterium]|nr:VWA domain-containing protein [Blastocatellia bacterium]